MGKRTLQISQHPPIPLLSPQPPPPASPLTVCLVDTVRIPPSSELEVLAYAHNPECPLTPQTCILEQKQTKKLAVCIARALVTPSPKGFPVRLLNPSSDPVVLYKGTSVATIEPIAGTHICPVSSNKPTQLSVAKQEILYTSSRPDNNSLSSEQSHALLSVLMAYADVFADGPEDVGRTNKIQHRIHTGDSAPIHLHPRRIPAAHREEARSLVKEMLKGDTIQPSSSPWASPIVLVRKKNGTL